MGKAAQAFSCLTTVVCLADGIDINTVEFMKPSSLTKGRELLPLKVYERGSAVFDSLPVDFDARTQWPNCTSIADIWDQSACGDCWAVATVTAAADRMCISTGIGGMNQPRLSVEHMVGCCRSCGYGCGDGFPNYAWNWLAGSGVVTGGGFQDYRWCSSYTLPPCNHYDSPNNTLPSCEGGIPAKTPQCPTACDRESHYNTSFKTDARKFKSAYAVDKSPENIMTELYLHGPVTAGMNVYKDFLHYKKGVYTWDGQSELIGGHAVRIIGWGVEEKQAYWLVANSFGTTWGNEGYFKIAKGHDTCVGGGEGTCIEDSVVAGLYQ